ncbi:MAG: VOC family protein [Candidatus Nanopelagicales bacterium]
MRYPDGLFGWVDLVTTDVAAAKEFYGGLFGWVYDDIPTPMGPVYTMCLKGEDTVAGIGPLPPDMAASGVPSMWNSYVLVSDLDATLARAGDAGGAVVMPAMQVMTQGRMAMVADPSGAAVGVWEPQDHQGADLFNKPGSLTWNELQSRDLAAATPFYAATFGWRWDDSMGDGYLVGHVDAKEGDDTSNCGAMATPPNVPAEVPSLWLAYFAVEDCATSVATAEGLGAQVFLPPMQMGPGTFAGLTDPTGAAVMVGSFPAA